MDTKRVLLDVEIAPHVADLFKEANIEADTVTPREGLLVPLLQHGHYCALLLQNTTQIPLDALAAAGDWLKVIGIIGDEIDNINVADASNHGILVKATEYGNSYKAANLALHLMVALFSQDFQDRKDKTALIISDLDELRSDNYSGFELANKTIGLIGCGKVAQTLAMEIRPYCGRIIGYDNNPRIVYENFHQRAPLDRSNIDYSQLCTILECSDIISIHTAGLDRVFKDNALYFAAKKPFIINTSRGGHIDDADLLAALQENRIRGAAFTLPAEQIKKGNFDDWVKPFLACKNVIITPALGKPTAVTKKKSARKLARSVIDYILNNDLSLAVNPMDTVSNRKDINYPLSRGQKRGSVPILLGR